MRAAALALIASLYAGEGAAQCASPATWFCTNPRRFGVVVTEAVDGARARVRVEQAGAGLTAGQTLELPRAWIEAPGKRWVLLDVERRAIDDAGNAVASLPVPGTPRVAADVVMQALSDPMRCTQKLEAAGLKLNGCHDTAGCGTSVAAVLPFPLLFGLGRIRRRWRKALGDKGS